MADRRTAARHYGRRRCALPSVTFVGKVRVDERGFDPSRRQRNCRRWKVIGEWNQMVIDELEPCCPQMLRCKSRAETSHWATVFFPTEPVFRRPRSVLEVSR